MHCTLNALKGALFIVVPMLVFTACKQSGNNPAPDDDDNGGYASDASRIEWVNNDVISIADEAGHLLNGAYLRTTGNTLGSCAYVGSDTTIIPHQLTVRFGDQDCTCLDGRVRRGTIIVYYMGHYSDTGQVHTITYSNYYINDNQLTGSVKTTRVDTTITGNWYYKVLVNDSLNVSPDPLNSRYIVWTGNLVRKWVHGDTTNDRSDDVFSVSGNTTLTRPNRHVFSCDIATPLQFAINCDYAESGVIDFSGYLSPVRVVNYGSGTCDANVQESIGPNVLNISLTK